MSLEIISPASAQEHSFAVCGRRDEGRWEGRLGEANLPADSFHSFLPFLPLLVTVSTRPRASMMEAASPFFLSSPVRLIEIPVTF